jgi:hypothetical protein
MGRELPKKQVRMTSEPGDWKTSKHYGWKRTLPVRKGTGGRPHQQPGDAPPGRHFFSSVFSAPSAVEFILFPFFSVQLRALLVSVVNLF